MYEEILLKLTVQKHVIETSRVLIAIKKKKKKSTIREFTTEQRTERHFTAAYVHGVRLSISLRWIYSTSVVRSKGNMGMPLEKWEALVSRLYVEKRKGERKNDFVDNDRTSIFYRKVRAW